MNLLPQRIKWVSLNSLKFALSTEAERKRHSRLGETGNTEKKAELVFHNFVIKRVSWCRHAAAEYYRILLLQHITANVLKQWNAFCSAAFLKIYFNVKVQVVHIFMVTFCVHLLHNNTIVITPLWMYAIAIKWTIKFRVICWSRHLTLATKVNLIWLKNNLCSIIHNI